MAEMTKNHPDDAEMELKFYVEWKAEIKTEIKDKKVFIEGQLAYPSTIDDDDGRCLTS
jgi:hypothetical protein